MKVQEEIRGQSRETSALAPKGGPSSLEVGKGDVHQEGGPEGGSRALQACLSDLGAGEGLLQPQRFHDSKCLTGRETGFV